MNELKPCPFCGGKANVYSYDPYDGYQGNCAVWRVMCCKCKALIQRGTKEEAVAAWNRSGMITDNQVKAAAMTISDYCSQRTGKEPCTGCAIRKLCEILREYEIPENWPGYMEEKNEFTD